MEKAQLGAQVSTNWCQRCKVWKMTVTTRQRWSIRSTQATLEEMPLTHKPQQAWALGASERCNSVGLVKALALVVRNMVAQSWTVSSHHLMKRHRSSSISRCFIQISNKNCNCHPKLHLICLRQQSRSICRERRANNLNIWSTRLSCRVITKT